MIVTFRDSKLSLHFSITSFTGNLNTLRLSGLILNFYISDKCQECGTGTMLMSDEGCTCF